MDDEHDVKALPGLVEESGRNVRVSKLYGDGAYDSSAVYRLLEGVGIEAVVKPKRNGRSDRGHSGRRRVVELIRRLGYDGWVSYLVMGGGGRWRRLTRRLSGCSVSTAWLGALRAS